MRRRLVLQPALALSIAISAALASSVSAQEAVVELQGDVRITEPTTWANAHYVVHGDVILAAGGALTVENATIELANQYAREFRYVWEGGKLVTRDSTIGGTVRDGVAQCSNIEVLDGEWEATDTTVRQCYGIVVGGYTTPGKLRATRLIAGPNPDSIIMGGQGDVVITDSSYAISLCAFASAGGGGRVLDLPVNTPISGVYDAQMLPGATYRLELLNTSVPLWFLFAGGVTMDGPPAEIVLGDCPSVIPSVMCTDLRGEVHLPCPWGKEPNASLKVGNLTWRTTDKPVGVFTWGVYLSGEKTDVTLTGPTLICELMVFAGIARLVGTEGTYDATTTATTIEVGSDAAPDTRASLEIRNAAIGRFAENDTIRGQITAHGRGEVAIEHARCAPLTLITKGQGTIRLTDILREGPIDRLEQGGPIEAR